MAVAEVIERPIAISVDPFAGLAESFARCGDHGAFHTGSYTMVRVHQLEIMAGIGIADHELKSIGPEISGPFPLTVPGNKLPNTADSSANLSTQYTQPIGNDPSFIGGIDYSRLGKTYWTLDNVLSEPTYNLVDPRLSFKWERFKLTGVVENLFDEEYFAQVFDQRWSGFVTNIGWPARPRYYGVELAFEF